jgi:site-specific recombinase XerD
VAFSWDPEGEGEGMIEKFFAPSFFIDRFRRGPLVGHADRFAALLCEQGYSRVAGQIKLRLIADFNQWLERKRLGVERLDERVRARYLRCRERSGWIPKESPHTLGQFLETLRQAGSTPPCNRQSIRSPREEFLNDYRKYLSNERGLAERTLPNVLMFVDCFLAEHYPDGHFAFAALTSNDVTRFVQRQAAKLNPGRARLLVTALRNFFRYLRHCGEIETDLAGCVPTVPYWSLSTVPKFLPHGSVERVLKNCDRSTSRGLRDCAILMLLARLGLRSSEITGLNLEDMNWDTGEITVRGKGGRWSKLPLSAEVGQAVADYLQRARPRCSTRRLFVRQIAPFVGLRSTCSIYKTAVRGLSRAGIDSANKGAHLFRHTLATAMLDRGATLGEIGEVLRHRSANTTRIYAKVDLPALRKLALPWPGGAR